MNQKCCTTCHHVEVNEMTDERYCMLEDGREIRLRYAKKRPDWCPKLGKRGDGMSVIVKGMEMPQKCGQCKLYHAETPMYCMAVEGYRTVGAPYGMPRPDWCPLIEIKTPHGRLIDADKLNIHDVSPAYGFCVMGVTEEDIELADTVIEGSETE